MTKFIEIVPKIWGDQDSSSNHRGKVMGRKTFAKDAHKIHHALLQKNTTEAQREQSDAKPLRHEGKSDRRSAVVDTILATMLRSFVERLSSRSVALQRFSPLPNAASFSSGPNLYMQPPVVHPMNPEDMPFHHHRKGPRYTDYVKFKSPRKRASKLLSELEKEAIEKSKASKPEVFEVDHRPGDAIELEIIEEGGVNAKTQKVRGVVIGKYNKGLDTSVLIRDVIIAGTIVERRLPLHSPLVKSMRLIQRNFLYKGRRKVKRAKLYFLRDRNPNETRVTKGKG